MGSSYKCVFNNFKISFTHIPIHPKELSGRFNLNIHGHTHGYRVTKDEDSYGLDGQVIDDRYLSVCPEIIGYKPMTLEEIFYFYNKLDKDSIL
jgi:calcineurin-like phosphoesterase family protein